MSSSLCFGLSFAGTLATLLSFAADVSTGRMVWAHYVPWVTPDNVSLQALRCYDYPQYDRTDRPYRDEIHRALSFGVGGFFVDIIGRKDGSPSAYWDLRQFLDASVGTSFQVGVCLDVKTDPETQTAELLRFLRTYGDHPNYPKWGDRYVVCFYTFSAWTPEELLRIREGCAAMGFPLHVVANISTAFKKLDMSAYESYLETFETFFTFGMLGSGGVSMRDEIRQQVAFAGRFARRFMPTVWPGYYGAWFSGRNSFLQPYCGFDTAQDRYEANRIASGAGWLHVTTWNDHDETTLQPKRLCWGNGPILKAMTSEFLVRPQASKTDVAFAYLRETMPGTLARIEMMRLPSADASQITVSGMLLDMNGAEVFELPRQVLLNGWERHEWLVPTTRLSASPYLLPYVRLSCGEVERVAFLPPIFLMSPCLRNPETVKVAFSNRSRLKSRLAVSWTNGVLTAECVFCGSKRIRRAVLFRNERPVSLFRGTADPVLPISWSCKSDVRIRVEKDARIVAAARSAQTNGTDRFRWDSHCLTSRKCQRWMMQAADLEIAPTETVELCVGKQFRRILPNDLVREERISLGDALFSRSDECLTYEPGVLNFLASTVVQRTYLPRPDATDAFWAEFELEDGTYAESRVIYPFATNTVPVLMNVVETDVTLDRRSGSSGPYCRETEYLTGRACLPISCSAICEIRVSPMSFRTIRYSCKNGVVQTKMRQWPMGAFELKFEVLPDSVGKGEFKLLSRGGWQEGPEATVLPDGRLEVAYCHGMSARYSIVTPDPLPTGRSSRVCLTSDCRRLTLVLDGHRVGTCELPLLRTYGNCEPLISGVDNVVFRPFVNEGRIDD